MPYPVPACRTNRNTAFGKAIPLANLSGGRPACVLSHQVVDHPSVETLTNAGAPGYASGVALVVAADHGHFREQRAQFDFDPLRGADQ